MSTGCEISEEGGTSAGQNSGCKIFGEGGTSAGQNSSPGGMSYAARRKGSACAREREPHDIL